MAALPGPERTSRTPRVSLQKAGEQTDPPPTEGASCTRRHSGHGAGGEMTGPRPRQGAAGPAGPLARKQGRSGGRCGKQQGEGRGRAPTSSLLLGGSRLAPTDAGAAEERGAVLPAPPPPTCPSQLSRLSSPLDTSSSLVNWVPTRGPAPAPPWTGAPSRPEGLTRVLPEGQHSHCHRRHVALKS